MIQKLRRAWKRTESAPESENATGQTPVAPVEHGAAPDPQAVMRTYGRRGLEWAVVLGSVLALGWLWRRSPAMPDTVQWHVRGWHAIAVAVVALLAGMWLWRTVFRLTHLALWLGVLGGLAWLYWHFYVGTPFPGFTWVMELIHFIIHISHSVRT